MVVKQKSDNLLVITDNGVLSTIISLVLLLAGTSYAIYKNTWYYYGISLLGLIILIKITRKSIEFDKEKNVVTFITKNIFQKEEYGHILSDIVRIEMKEQISKDERRHEFASGYYNIFLVMKDGNKVDIKLTQGSGLIVDLIHGSEKKTVEKISAFLKVPLIVEETPTLVEMIKT